MALAYLGVVLFGFIVVFIQTYTTEYTGQRAMHDLRMEIFSHLQKQDLAYFDRNPVGRLMTRTINDVETLNELFSTGVVGLLGDVSIVFGIAVDDVLARLEIGAGLSDCLSDRFFTSAAFTGRRARDVYRESRLILGRLNAGLQENIAGVATIQAFGQEEKMYRRFQDVNLSYRDVLLRSIRYNALFFPVIEVFSALTIGLLLWYGGRQILASTVSGRRDGRFYSVYPAHVPADSRPGGEIQHHAGRHGFVGTHFCAARYDRRRSRIRHDRKSSQRSRATSNSKTSGFPILPGTAVLKGISFRVRSGEKVALVGATGGGKTSIISALCRFYESSAARSWSTASTFANGTNRNCAASLGWSCRTCFFFPAISRPTSRWAIRASAEAEMLAAARRAHIAPFIEKLPNRYHEEVQERGATLSQGQRQLLSFARALAFDPKILILDEATSSVDTQTEMLIQEALDELLKNRTALIIAHRLSTIQHADRILVIHKGEIREDGSHEELLARGGLYARLYDLQYRIQDRDGTVGDAPASMTP